MPPLVHHQGVWAGPQAVRYKEGGLHEKFVGSLIMIRVDELAKR